jgi:hypothetical protein
VPPRPWELPPTDRPHVRDGMMGGTTRVGRDQRHVAVSAPDDKVDRVILSAPARRIAGSMVAK